jgi:hypothetical protein
MSQSNLVDDAKKVGQWVENKFGDPTKNAGKKVDPSWHAKAVAEANESFAKTQAKPAPLADKNLGSKKRATKGKASQKTAAKRY